MGARQEANTSRARVTGQVAAHRPIGTAAERRERFNVVIQAAGRTVEHVPGQVSADSMDVAQAGVETSAGSDVALEFVRFCHRRRRVGWPALYDEMCAVAARGTFKGMGYAELAEHGVSFCLSEMPVLVSLTERVVAEDRNLHEPQADPAPISISPVPARA